MKNPAKRDSRTKVRSAKKTKATGAGDLPAELLQLARVREKYRALTPAIASALLAQHDEASCRAHGGDTKASDTFKGAMAWARTLGENADDPGVPPMLARWFLDCLTALGAEISGHGTASNPAAATALADAVHAADRLLSRVTRRARAAVGANVGWKAALATALSPAGGTDLRVATLGSLADQLAAWLDSRAAAGSVPPLAAYDITNATVVSLRHAAAALGSALEHKPAQKQFDHDAPQTNELEGRLYYAMRSLWDHVGEAREDGITKLQFPMTPVLLRGLDLGARKKAGAAAKPAPAAGATG